MTESKFVTHFHVNTQTELRRVDRREAMRILRKLSDLDHDPYGYDSTELVGRPGERRIRVGNWRVVYEVHNQVLVVMMLRVGHRSESYDSR